MADTTPITLDGPTVRWIKYLAAFTAWNMHRNSGIIDIQGLTLTEAGVDATFECRNEGTVICGVVQMTFDDIRMLRGAE